MKTSEYMNDNTQYGSSLDAYNKQYKDTSNPNNQREKVNIQK